MALVDFQDIYQKVIDELKLDANDANELERIKSDINLVYLDLVVPKRRWKWLSGRVDKVHSAYIADGTVSVTPNSTTVTFSVAPTASKTGYKFAVNDYNEIYTISSHTAASTTATLETAYTGTLNATANYKVWTDKVNLPTNCRETVEVYHDHYNVNMDPLGLQEFRRRVQENPRVDGRPVYYSTYDYEDPTPLTDMTETDRYRVMLIHPAISQYSTTIHIDYTKEAEALVDDADEPLMPVEDRVVLVYGALERAWDRARNETMGQKNAMRFEQKLAHMEGRVEDSYDKPQIVPNSEYIARKRSKSSLSPMRASAVGSGGSYSAPSYLANVIIAGANITGNVTVTNGITIDGRDISADGATLDALNTLANGKIYIGDATNLASEQTMSGDITMSNVGVTAITAGVIVDADINASAAITKTKLATGTASRVEITDGSGNLSESAVTSTELTYLSNVEALTSATLADNTAAAANVATWTLASFDSIVVDYSLKRGSSNKACGRLFISTDGTNAAIAQSESSIGTLGVTFTADVSAGSLRLRYTTTSTGTAVTMKYKINKWLA